MSETMIVCRCGAHATHEGCPNNEAVEPICDECAERFCNQWSLRIVAIRSGHFVSLGGAVFATEAAALEAFDAIPSVMSGDAIADLINPDGDVINNFEISKLVATSLLKLQSGEKTFDELVAVGSTLHELDA